MPSFQYWFSGAALWLAGSFIITVILGVIGVKTMISNKMAVFLIGLALLVMLIGWWTTAEQEEASARQGSKLDEMAATLNLIKDSLPASIKSPAVDNLTNESNGQLRQRVAALTADMRAFEVGMLAARDRVMNSPVNPNATQEEKTAQFQKTVAATTEQYSQAQSEFRSRFLPEALALREEMSRRLGIMKPYPPDRQSIALDYGMLAGVHPISESAVYLESLARQMPP